MTYTCARTHRAMLAVLETLTEIQDGPNPLTQAELDALLDEQPELKAAYQARDVAEAP